MNSSPASLRERLSDWLNDRTGLVDGFRQCHARRTPAGWWLGSFWPSLIVFVFVIELLTGLVLWMYYSPSSQTAWESVYYLQHEVTLGWLLRGVHFYGSQVLVALIGLYVVQLVLMNGYRRPREFVFWAAVLLGMIAAALNLTGDLLPWDQSRYWASQTRVSFLMLLPEVGGYLYRLALGGPSLGHLTLTRFFALHVGLFSVVFTGLLLLHGWFLRRAARIEAARGEVGPVYWPNQFARNAAGWVAVMAVILLLVFQNALTGEHGGQAPGAYLGIELGAPADTNPANAYAAARPEWSFRGLYALAHRFSGAQQIIPIFILPHAALLVILAMPLIAYWRFGHALNVLVLLLLIGGIGYLSWESYRDDFADPDFRAAVAADRQMAHRTVELARVDGISSGGALTLLRSDPRHRGPALFAQHCAACHAYSGPDAPPTESAEVSAADLYQIGTRQWIEGLLDAERFSSPAYFGHTRFAAGIMAEFLQGRWQKLSDEQRSAIVAALAAEAGSPAQPPEDAKQTALIASGRSAIIAECTGCHAFHEHGQPGEAPTLTGYGSREWLIGMIADPGHPWFYGPQNDRMPAYLEAPDQPDSNRLSADELQTLVSWLRGEWPGSDSAMAGQGAAPASPPPVLFSLGQWQARRPIASPDESDAASPRGQALAVLRLAQCTLCHDYSDGQGGGIASRHPVAASLWDFGSSAWLQGLLDPQQVDGPRYFGNNSKFSGGDMVSFVQGDLYDSYLPDVGQAMLDELLETAVEKEQQIEFALEHLTEWKDEIGEEELRKQVAEAVANDGFEDYVQEHAEPLIERLGRQRLQTLVEAIAAQRTWDEPQEMDEQMVATFEEFGCADCHKFHDAGDLGSAPDLTGYGSREWLTAMITDPEHERFYPEANDGMPAYHAFPDQPQKNLLSVEQIRLLADLLRGKLESP